MTDDLPMTKLKVHFIIVPKSNRFVLKIFNCHQDLFPELVWENCITYVLLQ